jgi:hypothetical protein
MCRFNLLCSPLLDIVEHAYMRNKFTIEKLSRPNRLMVCINCLCTCRCENQWLEGGTVKRWSWRLARFVHSTSQFKNHGSRALSHVALVTEPNVLCVVCGICDPYFVVTSEYCMHYAGVGFIK